MNPKHSIILDSTVYDSSQNEVVITVVVNKSTVNDGTETCFFFEKRLKNNTCIPENLSAINIQSQTFLNPNPANIFGPENACLLCSSAPYMYIKVHFRLDLIGEANTLNSEYTVLEQSDPGPYCLQYRLNR